MAAIFSWPQCVKLSLVILYMLSLVIMEEVSLSTFTVLCFPAKTALMEGQNPVIIDNTNSQSWEMKVYVSLVSIEKDE